MVPVINLLVSEVLTNRENKTVKQEQVAIVRNVGKGEEENEEREEDNI